MRLTTANLKSHNYTESHELFVGTHTGSFKRLCAYNENPYVQTNLQDLKALEKDSRVTVLEYGNEESSEILVGRANKIVQVFDVNSNNLISSSEFPDAPIVGLAKYDNKLIAGVASGKVYVLQNSENVDLMAGDNMSRMRQCQSDRKLIATGGKDRQNNLKVFNLERMEKVFSSKNLPNDFLQLEVPIWDTDMGFIDANIIATCSRYGYVRLYDTRKQRRPVQKYANDDQMSFSCLLARDNFVYTGTTMGALKAFDTRNFKNFVHTYKGFTGGLSNLCLDETGKYLSSACLDRYVRVHHVDTCAMMYQCYVKSKATSVLIKNIHQLNEEKSDDGDNEKEEQVNHVEENSDEEYNAMFDKMQTVSEKDEAQAEDVKQKKKRKYKHNDKNIKKKKV